MRKNVQILDCTLRDGGRIIDCRFDDRIINNLVRDLSDAEIDIVELGFLRAKGLVEYNRNSTFFTNTDQIGTYIPLNRNNTMYVAFVDY